MAKRTVEVKIPGAQTPEGRRRIYKATEERNQADFECFMTLRELEECGVLTRGVLARAIKEYLGVSEDEATDMAVVLAGDVKRNLKRRRDAETELMDAIRGIER